MNVNPFGSSSIYTNSTPNTMNANQSCGLRFGASSDDYDYYNSSVPKKKESFWQKWKKVIIGGFVTVGVGILGIVGYNKGWFSKAKNVATSRSSQPKPNNFETALKTLGLEDLKVDGKDIKNLLKNDTKTVSQKQFTDVVIAIHGKVENSSNEIKIAAVTILEQLRKNLANKNEKIGNFDLKSEINDIDVLNEILKEANQEKKVEAKEEEIQPVQTEQPEQTEVIPTKEEKEKKAKQPVQLEQPEQSAAPGQSTKPEQQVQPAESVHPVQPEVASTEEDKKKVVEQLKKNALKEDVIDALLGGSDEAERLKIIKDNADDIAEKLTDLIDETPALKDNAAFQSLVTSFYKTCLTQKNIIDNQGQVDSIIKKLLTAIEQGVINDNIEFDPNTIIALNDPYYIAWSLNDRLTQNLELSTNDAYKSLVTSFYKACLTQKDVVESEIVGKLLAAIKQGVINDNIAFAPGTITDTNADFIAWYLSKNITNDKLKTNDVYKSLVTSFLIAVNKNKGLIKSEHEIRIRDIVFLLAAVVKENNGLGLNKDILQNSITNILEAVYSKEHGINPDKDDNYLYDAISGLAQYIGNSTDLTADLKTTLTNTQDWLNKHNPEKAEKKTS